jgi:hypothetical protein
MPSLCNTQLFIQQLYEKPLIMPQLCDKQLLLDKNMWVDYANVMKRSIAYANIMWLTSFGNQLELLLMTTLYGNLLLMPTLCDYQLHMTTIAYASILLLSIAYGNYCICQHFVVINCLWQQLHMPAFCCY